MTFPVAILVEESAGYQRAAEPVTLGVPLPRGLLSGADELTLSDPAAGQLSLQADPLAHWPDGSIKWLLLDFQLSVAAGARKELLLNTNSTGSPAGYVHKVTTSQEKDAFIVETGVSRFALNPKIFQPFKSVRVAGEEMVDADASCVTLTDAHGNECRPEICTFQSEAAGSLRTTLKVTGRFRTAQGKAFASFVARLHFFAGKSLVKMTFTLHNPRAAKHRGGLWDLGDPGSLYFNDLSLQVGLQTSGPVTTQWQAQPADAPGHTTGRDLVIYQDSSGGENWRSSNHVNRCGEVRHSFRGYRVSSEDKVIKEGLRASPLIGIRDKGKQITAGVQSFWQNFPKALEARDGVLTVRLFPHQYDDLFELQGGEQKTHTLYLDSQAHSEETTPSNGCHSRAGGNLGGQAGACDTADLRWIDAPLIARCTPEWYAASGAVRGLTREPENSDGALAALVNCAINGDNTFFHRREVIDEYGWRNFGELYADHEAVFHQGPQALVSHYNNQYDAVFGFLRQFLAGGDPRWFLLADQLCHHVRDIDIYHTGADRPAYNHGLFWHTNHHLDAATCTHRCFSKAHAAGKARKEYGGGPALSHLYTSGLLLHYYATGEVSSREAVLELVTFAEANLALQHSWRQRLRAAAKRVQETIVNLKFRQPGPSNNVYGLAGPGRASGNTLNTLLDGFALTGERRYLQQAEALIRSCVHPQDDIGSRDLLDVERRWMYTIFLQALGGYLDVKSELGQADAMFEYARASLLHYATWMLDNEYIYLDKPEKLEFPNETWAAQEMRKGSVLNCTAPYSADSLKRKLVEKAEYYCDAGADKLARFVTKNLTRPVVLILSSGVRRAYFVTPRFMRSMLSPKVMRASDDSTSLKNSQC